MNTGPKFEKKTIIGQMWNLTHVHLTQCQIRYMKDLSQTLSNGTKTWALGPGSNSNNTTYMQLIEGR